MREKLLKILNNPKSTKEQLRAALASALGVKYAEAAKPKSLFTLIKEVFCEEYKRHAKVDYSFTAKDGKAVSSLIKKLTNLCQHSDEKELLNTFQMLIKQLPQWYKDNAYSLSIIDSKFNEIVASIKNGTNKKDTGGISSDYKEQLAARIAARRNNQKS